MTRASRIADPIDIGKVAKPPPIRLPDPMTVFACRAERFADLAAGNPMADFLSFMAEIVHAQTAALGVLAVATPPETCSGWATPPLDRSKWRPDPSWRHALTVILDRLDAAALTAETRSAIERLAGQSPDALDALAEKAVHFEYVAAAPAEASLAFAALQVCWTRMAGDLLQPEGDDATDRVRACPACRCVQESRQRDRESCGSSLPPRVPALPGRPPWQPALAALRRPTACGAAHHPWPRAD